MITIRPLLTPCLLATALIGLAGCQGKSTDKKADGKTAKAEGDTKIKPPAAKRNAGKAGKGMAMKPPKDAKAGGGGPKSFKKGQVVPRGLSNEELAQYNKSQGDPNAEGFSLEQAFEGDDKLADKAGGKLKATFVTSMGDFECDLYEDKAPTTVANFVGLARGTRPSYDKDGDEWKKKPFYDGVLFHRVIKNFMIQTGDPTASGSGGPGYAIVDEFDDSLKHTGPGFLSMANRGPNTGSSQFFVTVKATPHLNGKHAIFGKCDAKLPVQISEVKVDPRRGNRPYEPVSIKTIKIARKK